MGVLKVVKKLLTAVALCGVTAAALASPAAPKDGVEYQTLATPQNTDSGKKVEVIEFFAYYCPHCYAFEPKLSAWVRKQGSNIVYKRVHVPYDERTVPQQKLYFTLESMGVADQFHYKVFQAMHVDHRRLGSDEEVFDFAASLGIDRQKFIDTYRSFGVAAKMRRADSMMEAYKVESWPLIVIDGRYKTSPAQAGQTLTNARDEAELHDASLSVMDFLVARAKAEKK
jgi:thiol:disulfide interchange protein DsbA